LPRNGDARLDRVIREICISYVHDNMWYDE